MEPPIEHIIDSRDPEEIVGWEIEPTMEGPIVEVWFEGGYRTSTQFVEKVSAPELKQTMELHAPDKEGLPEATDCHYCGGEIVEGQDEKHMIEEGIMQQPGTVKKPMCGRCWSTTKAEPNGRER